MFLSPIQLPDVFEWWNVRAAIEEWAYKVLNSSRFVPPGVIMAYGFATPPEGWVECDGATYEITKFPDLYDAIRDTYGATATTFDVPTAVAPPVGEIWIIKT